MYNSPYRPINPYAQRLSAMEQQQQMVYPQPQGIPSGPQPQPIQNLGAVQPQIVCYSVNSNEDMGKINVMYDTIYLGLNSKTKEIYTRRMTNDGLLETETYTLASGTKEKGDLQAIADKLEEIEKKISNIQTQRPTLTLKGGSNEERITKNSVR